MLNDSLSDKEVNQYHEEGYIGPYKLFGADRAGKLLKQITTQIDNSQGHPSGIDAIEEIHDRHLDIPEMYEICSDPGIVERTANLYGNDLVLWSSRMWKKESGAREFPWHQGDHFHPIEPPVTLTAWVALTNATEANGCCQVIPNSHKDVLPHIEASDDMGFTEMADPSQIDEDRAVSLELEPGECFMFNERCLHRSLENETDTTRIGVSARITLPFVKTRKPYGTTVLKGEDDMNINGTTTPPIQ